ncbi:CHAT domain-containing protein [Nocardia arizonensis]|uniref:CHAT domain-containing protein n=1 Tax=Nocardia arizonensis TaxID=1141647 RepID=UPI0006D1869B|nr:CHAT domain-containing protein [Nocardia arizonensis]
MMTNDWTDWSDVLEYARTAPDPERARLLACICVAAVRMCRESLGVVRTGGFPSGRPDKLVVRAAARQLRDVPAGEDTRQAAGYRVLALTHLTYSCTATVPGELDTALEEARRALDEVVPEDPLIVALAHFLLARRFFAVRDSESENSHYEIALTTLRACDQRSTEHWLYRTAPFLTTDSKPGFGQRLMLRLLLHRVDMYLNLNDSDRAQRAADELVAFTEAHQDTQLGDYCWSLQRRARVERERRDVEAFTRTEKLLERISSDHPQRNAVRLYWLRCAADNASKLLEFDRSTTLFKERMAVRARWRLGVELDPSTMTAAQVCRLVGGISELNSPQQLTNVGNDAFDLALNLYDSGTLRTDPQARAEALGYLDAAAQAWQEFAVNGIHTVSLARAQIELLQPDPPLPRLTEEILRVEAAAPRFTTRRRAMITAVRHGSVGDGRVLRRLGERIAQLESTTSSGPELGTLYGLTAEFHLRVCRAAETAGEVPDWHAAEDAAMRAAPLLRPASVSYDPDLEATVWQTAAAAMPDPPERLNRMLRAIGCVAEHTITIANSETRRSATARFARLFADAADLAVALDEHAAADLIMEAARRDRVGLLLAELIANPRVDDAIRSAALSVTASRLDTPVAGSADADEEGGYENGEKPPPKPDTEQRTRERSAQILVDRARAIADAEQVLGPLGALCDPAELANAHPGAVLSRRATPTATALLQLYRPNGPDDDPPRSGTATFYRRVTLCHAGTITEHLDAVHVPAVLTALHAQDRSTYDWAPTLAKALLPPPLRQFVRDHRDEGPIRLLIVPTGSFDIPFDVLPVDDRPLIDDAVISIHGSLTGTLALLQVRHTGATAPSLAVYDAARLSHATAELDALCANLIDIAQVGGYADLHRALATQGPSPYALLAMAVHGSHDESGWGQAKQLPDGTTVQASDVFSWSVPRLCVLASCHSSITSPDGIEIGGFPLALMLRGATTVIGSLFAIDDQATAEIMSSYWRLLGEGVGAAAALRLAKLRWRDSDPGADPRHWAGLVTYGAGNQ